MDRELILCVPGPWPDRSSFVRQVVASAPGGGFLFAGQLLMETATKDCVPVDFCEADPLMARAFKIGGQGRISESCLDQIGRHASVIYLHFRLDLVAERERILKFTRLLRALGGLAVKDESSGVAHEWETWEDRLTGSLFDLYCAAVVLVGDKAEYYSCGMHQFGLPECSVPRTVEIGAAAEVMNRFNFWQINDRPALAAGEMFALAGKPAFRLQRESDGRHADDELFHNPQGVWRLELSAPTADRLNNWQKPEGEPLFVAISKDDPKMAEAYTRARASFADFVRATRSPRFSDAISSVKIKLRDNEHSAEMGEDRHAYLWLQDVREERGELCARVFELPKGGINDLVEGGVVRFSVDAVRDWMLREGSTAWGGFTLRVVRDSMDPRERLDYDDYIGIMSYHDRLPPMPT